MTIEKGQPWGGVVERPSGIRFVDGDAAVAAALTDGSGVPVAVVGGDLHRTVGGRNPEPLTEVLELPLDLLEVRLDDRPVRAACAHVLIQTPRRRGGWWRGEFIMIMNAEFVGSWHVVARGHPNDGRAEVCAWDGSFRVRQRWEARRRLPTGGHVPHPQIETRTFKHRIWEFDRPMQVRIDGVVAGVARRIEVTVQPDAAVVYA